MNNNISALLPMKIHSERVYNKNIRSFGGMPLFFLIADTLKTTCLFSNLIINTDSLEIATMATERYKDWVIIHNRSDELCGDYVSMNQIIENDLELFDSKYYFQTHSTNPLLKKDTIIEAVGKYFENRDDYDSLFSVNKLKVRIFDKELSPINHRSGELIRTQDLEPVFEENSNFYIFSKSSFISAGNNRIGKNPTYFEVNKLESIDIDDEEDFILAEAIYYKCRENES